jgi:hypothetical protein
MGECEERIEAQYGYLRGDPAGTLQQVWAEIDTALDLDMVTSPTTARVLLEGLKAKCELGLAPAGEAAGPDREDGQ